MTRRAEWSPQPVELFRWPGLFQGAISVAMRYRWSWPISPASRRPRPLVSADRRVRCLPRTPPLVGSFVPRLYGCRAVPEFTPGHRGQSGAADPECRALSRSPCGKTLGIDNGSCLPGLPARPCGTSPCRSLVPGVLSSSNSLTSLIHITAISVITVTELMLATMLRLPSPRPSSRCRHPAAAGIHGWAPAPLRVCAEAPG